MSTKGIIGITIFSLALILISFYLINTIDPGKKAKVAISPIIDMTKNDLSVNTSFTLEDDKGSVFNYSNLEGKFSLIYFGFSYCPDICPLTLQKLSQVSSSLKDANNNIQFIFVSVDPQRDDLQTLQKFTEEFDNKIIGVTGTKEEIEKLASSLKVYYAATNNTDNKNYFVDHSSFIYLVNQSGKLLYQFTQDATAQQISEQLSKTVNSK